MQLRRPRDAVRAGGRAAGGAGGLEGVVGEPADLPVGARAGGGWGTATPWLVVQPGKGPVVGRGGRRGAVYAVDLIWPDRSGTSEADPGRHVDVGLKRPDLQVTLARIWPVG